MTQSVRQKRLQTLIISVIQPVYLDDYDTTSRIIKTSIANLKQKGRANIKSCA